MRFDTRALSNILLALLVAAIAPIHAEEPTGDESAATSNDAGSVPRVPPFLKRPILIEGDFIDGWKQTIPIETQFSKGESVTLWIEDGWLAARRHSGTGAIDWQVFLCPADDIEEPMISVRDGLLFFEVTYGDGFYFIRDSDHIFRCRRMPKLGGTLITKSDVVSNKSTSRGSANSRGIKFAGLVDREWYHVVAGPLDDRWNMFVRLNPDSNGKKGSGVTVCATGLTHWHHGDTWLIDDGELIVANRTLEALYLAEKKQQAETKEQSP